MPETIAEATARTLADYEAAELAPRVPCTRCSTGLCLNLPWIERPICDPCWAKIESQGKLQSAAEEFATRRKLSGLPSGFYQAQFADFKQQSGPYTNHQLEVALKLWNQITPAKTPTGSGLPARHSHRPSEHNQSSGTLGTLVVGPPGTGKTHLLAALTNELLKTQPVVWLDLQQLQFELGRSVFAKDKEPVEPYGKRLVRDTGIIIIDDFSFDKQPYDWLAGQIRGFFNDLVAQGRDIRLFMSTNNRFTKDLLQDPVTHKQARNQELPSLLELFGAATVSRLKQLTQITPFLGPDRRLQ